MKARPRHLWNCDCSDWDGRGWRRRGGGRRGAFDIRAPNSSPAMSTF